MVFGRRSGVLSGSSRGAEEAATSPVRELRDQHQEHAGRGLGLGEGKGGTDEQKGLPQILRPPACRLMYPIQGLGETPGSDQQTTATSQESGLTKGLLRPGQVFSQP